MSAEKAPSAIRGTNRKRAAAACLPCRARKVRCDVVHRGQPCLNCHLDYQNCVVKKRPTRYRIHREESEGQPEYQSEKTLPLDPQTIPNMDNSAAHGQASGDVARQSNDSAEPLHSSGSPHEHGEPEVEGLLLDHSVEEMTGASPLAVVRHELQSDKVGDMGQSDRTYQPTKATPVASSLAFDPIQIESDVAAAFKTHLIFSYYSFLKLDNMSHISPEEAQFLEQEQCFRIPIRPMLNDFVREYFLHVHPNVPFLNEGDFWDMYTQRDQSASKKSQISLFLFQAMLFAACSFVSEVTVRKLGFASIMSARKAYYNRAKALFNSDLDGDEISKAQGTLLLTYHTSINSSKDNSYWMGIAIHFARHADAHQYRTSNLSPKQKNALKRLWWSCILRDRIISLGMRRPSKINSEDFDCSRSLLDEGDFEDEIGRSKIYEDKTQRSMIHLLTAFCELAVFLTDTIEIIYPSKAKHVSDSPTERDLQQDLTLVQKCKVALDNWFKRTTGRFPTPIGTDTRHESLILYTNLTYIYYYSAVVALCHHEMLLFEIHSKDEESHWNQRFRSKRQLEEAAGGITESLKTLIQFKLLKYLPISVAAYATLPVVWHTLNVKLSTTVSQMTITQRRLSIYTAAMRAFETQFDGIDQLFEILGQFSDQINFENSQTAQASRLATNPKRLTQIDQQLSLDHRSRALRISEFSNWGDILLQQPDCYLRLTLTIDLTISSGQFRDDVDLPISLLPRKRATPFPLYRIAISENNGGVERNPDSHNDRIDTNCFSKTQNTEADYFPHNYLAGEDIFCSEQPTETPGDDLCAQVEFAMDVTGFEMLLQDYENLEAAFSG